jgi:cytidylate kinase
VLAAQERRDTQDESRAVGPLVPAANAIEVGTNGVPVDQVVDRLEVIARDASRRGKSTRP